MLFPNFIKKKLYSMFLGYSFGKDVKIGFSYINVNKAVFRDKSRIGHFNFINRLNYFEIGPNFAIGNLNSIKSSPEKEWDRKFISEKDGYITSRHLIDVGGIVKFGKCSILGGVGSTIWSHGISIKDKKIKPKNVYIGDHVYIGAGSQIAPGVSIPNGCIIGMGTVLATNIELVENSIIRSQIPTVEKRKNY